MKGLISCTLSGPGYGLVCVMGVLLATASLTYFTPKSISQSFLFLSLSPSLSLMHQSVLLDATKDIVEV